MQIFYYTLHINRPDWSDGLDLQDHKNIRGIAVKLFSGNEFPTYRVVKKRSGKL